MLEKSEYGVNIFSFSTNIIICSSLATNCYSVCDAEKNKSSMVKRIIPFISILMTLLLVIH